jgi:hypothetical protein
MHGYSFLDQCFEDGAMLPWTLPDLGAIPPGADFESLGFDAVSKSVSDFFECSPLSCNREARRFRVNPRCLFDSLDDAVAAAKEFSRSEPEPGPYYVTEVWRRLRAPRR